VRAAEARVALMQKNVGDGMVRAPFAGMIAERPVAAGEYVRADTRVATLLAVETLRLELTVPETDALAVAVGQVVRFHVASVPDATFEGTIRFLGPALRRGTRDLLVEALVPNADGRLRPGMFAVSEVDLGQVDRIAVPRTALRMDDGTAHVFVAQDGRLDERVVRLGPETGDQVVVLEGLSAGERVVAPLDTDVRDGRAVAQAQ
jgi:membrane fusion protein (multidrug efflux system)